MQLGIIEMNVDIQQMKGNVGLREERNDDLRGAINIDS